MDACYVTFPISFSCVQKGFLWPKYRTHHKPVIVSHYKAFMKSSKQDRDTSNKKIGPQS